MYLHVYTHICVYIYIYIYICTYMYAEREIGISFIIAYMLYTNCNLFYYIG